MYSNIYQYSNEDIKIISVCVKVHVNLVLGVLLKELRDGGVKIVCSSTPPVTEQDDRTGARGICRSVVKIK
jgi:S-adenosylhomocysteine hydrolase